jgi:acylphosphatase
MKKHFNIKVIGEVQGVFFRASTKEKADTYGINGYVRNETDGSVYIEAEGEEADLKKFIQWCQQGPVHARIESCKASEAPMTGYKDFVIQRNR